MITRKIESVILGSFVPGKVVILLGARENGQERPAKEDYFDDFGVTHSSINNSLVSILTLNRVL